MPKSKADIMRDYRAKKTDAGLKTLLLWVYPEFHAKVIAFANKINRTKNNAP